MLLGNNNTFGCSIDQKVQISFFFFPLADILPLLPSEPVTISMLFRAALGIWQRKDIIGVTLNYPEGQ